METLQRIQDWAAQGISMDVTTMILRSEGVPDEEIASAYDSIISLPGYQLTVERGIATIRVQGHIG